MGGAVSVLSFVKIDLRITTMIEIPGPLTRAMVRSRAKLNARTDPVLMSGQVERSIRADPFRAHPDLKRAPRCRKCKGPTSKKKANPENVIGNGGRPFYRCDRCEMFSCFGDMRGIHASNPKCNCSLRRRSRAVLNKQWDEIRGGRAAHFRCAVGECGFDKPGGLYRRRDERLRVQDVVRAGL